MALKRFVTSAALVVLGCSDVPTDSVEVPPYGGVAPFDSTGTPSAEQPGDTGGSNEAAESANSGVNAPAAGSSQPTNEDPNANLPIASSTPEDTGGSSDTGGGDTGGGDTGGTTPPVQDGSQAGTGQDGNQAGTGQNGGQTGTGQNGGQNGTGAQPPPPPPPPPPRPPLDCNNQPTLTGGTQSCSVNAGGTINGQNWFMWYSGSNGCMTTFPQGGFRATWNNSGDFLARSGLQFDETKTFDQYGTIGADLAFTKTGTGGGYSFIGIYGWSNNPLIEYYIVENSFQNGVTTPYGTTQRGQFTVDGATYRVYSGAKQNQPSIHGNANFTQYFSVRQTPRTCGHVSISEHFKQWASMGLPLGKLYEAKILVEAGGGSGSVTFTTAYVSASAGGN
ncbi:MAG TPA: glycoside hydrolase family 11 protein [Polyangiaceae bacterium]|nr:glycoside hydrolase family 11 protein [Polyangiaceae bacterium]